MSLSNILLGTNPQKSHKNLLRLYAEFAEQVERLMYGEFSDGLKADLQKIADLAAALDKKGVSAIKEDYKEFWQMAVNTSTDIFKKIEAPGSPVGPSYKESIYAKLRKLGQGAEQVFGIERPVVNAWDDLEKAIEAVSKKDIPLTFEQEQELRAARQLLKPHQAPPTAPTRR